MAKQRYDVNTNIRLLESHKQFTGGLKTVDTDDSLKAFYLREAENISLSEFGFLEKRYGIINREEFSDILVDVNSKVQGYFEYKHSNGAIDKILFVDGNLYLNNVKITKLDKEYPDTLTYISEEVFSVLAETTYTNFGSIAVFDTGKEIEATRIDNILYIFTGVYPIYYKGDGNFYLMPEYLPDFTQLVNFSDNLMHSDLATAYTTGIVNDLTCDLSDNVDHLEISKIGYSPYLPYTNNEGTIFTINVAYNIPDNAIYNGVFEKFTDGAGTANQGWEQFGGGSLNLYSGGIFTEVFPILYYRASGAGESDLEWIQMTEGDYSYDLRSNGTDGINTASFQTLEGDLGATPHYSAGLELSEPMEIKVTSMPVGLYDIKVELNVRVSGYKIHKDTSTIIETEFISEIINQPVEIIQDIQFLPEDYDYPELNTELWSCNKVLNHYGKLMAYGAGETVFVSHPSHKEYFPAYFTMKFETDADEPIQKITPFMNILVVQSETHTWGLKGIDALVDADNPYSQFTISPLYGTIAPKSVRPVRNHLYFLSKQGIVKLKSFYANDDQYNIEHIDMNIKNIVPIDPDAVAIQFDDQYWINFPNTEDNMTLRYYVDKQAWIKDTYFQYNGLDSETNTPQLSTTEFKGIFKYYRDVDDLVMITEPLKVGDNYYIYKLVVDYTMPTDLDEVPRTLLETSYLNQDQPFHPKKYLEEKLDFTLQNEYSAGGYPIYTEDEIDIGSIAAHTIDRIDLKANHTYSFNSSDKEITNVSLKYFDIEGNDITDTILGAEVLRDVLPQFSELEVLGGQITFKITNNNTQSATLYYDTEQVSFASPKITIGAGETTANDLVLDVYRNGLNTVQARFIFADGDIGEIVQKSVMSGNGIPMPEVSYTDTTTDSITFKITNNAEEQATIYYSLDDENFTAPDTVVLAAGAESAELSYSALTQTIHNIYMYAELADTSTSNILTYNFDLNQELDPVDTFAYNSLTDTSVRIYWTDDSTTVDHYSLAVTNTTTGGDPVVYDNITDLEYSLSLIAENSYSVTITSWDTDHTNPISAEYPTPLTFTADETPLTQINTPNITDITWGTSSVSFRVVNVHPSVPATITYELNDSTPDAYSVNLSGGGTSDLITLSGYVSGYNRIYAQASATGYADSDVRSSTAQYYIKATFNSNGGSPSYSSQSIIGYEELYVTNPGTPTRSGYDFDGWSPSVPRTITSSTTFTAQWTEQATVPDVPTGLFYSSSNDKIYWDIMDNTTYYQVEIAEDSSFSSVILSNYNLNTNNISTVGLAPFTYYARAKACNAVGCSNWSSTLTFTVT